MQYTGRYEKRHHRPRQAIERKLFNQGKTPVLISASAATADVIDALKAAGLILVVDGAIETSDESYLADAEADIADVLKQL